MARRFNGTTDYIDCGSGASLDDLGGSPPAAGQRAFACWYYNTGPGETGARLFQKSLTTNAGWFYAPNDAGVGKGTLYLGNATTTVSNPVIPNFAWAFVGGSYLPGDGGGRIYLGSLTAAVVEATYSARGDVSTYVSDEGSGLYLGNGSSAALRTLDGWIALFAVFDNALTLNQFELIRSFPRMRGQLFPLDMLSFFQTAAGTRINCKGLWLMDM